MRKITCVTGEVAETYNAYLKTQHWRNIKAEYKRTHEYKCQHCGDSNPGLHLHHLTYERIGNEDMTDFIYLCELCHAVVHSKPKVKRRKPKTGKVRPKKATKPLVPGKKKKKDKKKKHLPNWRNPFAGVRTKSKGGIIERTVPLDTSLAFWYESQKKKRG